MRIKITAETNFPIEIPFNYQYLLQAAIYNILKKSSNEYSSYLHDIGFINEDKHLKLFTFSKLNFDRFQMTKYGFKNVRKIDLIFSTIISKSFEHLILGIFSDEKINLNFNHKKHVFQIRNVETLQQPEFSEKMKFTCLSPITVSTKEIIHDNLQQHFLDYMNPKERDHFNNNIRDNLLLKYKLINNEEFKGNRTMDFHFDSNYIIKKNGKISKLLTFKNGIKIKAMEAPFTINTDPELIKIGYECGFGDKNSAGFGMVEVVR